MNTSNIRRLSRIVTVVLLSGLATVAAALMAPAFAAAQEPAIVQGTVADAATGVPIQYALITIDGTVLRSITDVQGRYRLAGVRPGAVTVRAGRVGYRGAELHVTLDAGQEYTGDFLLTTSVVGLEAIVVTGTAGELRRRAQAATVTDIDVTKIADVAPVTTVGQVLQSRVPGVSVLASSGTSGASTVIRVRGASSISLSNEPLLYVDGVRVATGASSFWFTGGQLYDRLNDVDPSDVESIELVKGPAAATLYGANASAGVIQIITKRGRPGEGAFSQTLSFEQHSIDRNFTPPDNFGRCTAALVASTSLNPLCRGQVVGTLVRDNPLLREGAFRTGHRTSVLWSGRGGGQNYGYYTSANFDTEDGVLPNNAFQRATGRANFNWIPAPTLTIDAGMSLLRSRTNLPDNDNNIFGWLGNAQLGSPLTRRDDASGNNGWFGNQRDVAAMRLIENQRQTHRTTATMTAKWAPLSWLSHRFTVGGDWLHDEDRRFLPRNTRGSYAINVGQIQELRRGVEQYTIDYLGNARTDLTDGVVSNLSLGVQMIETRTEFVSGTGEGLTVNSNNVVTAASTRSGGQDFQLVREAGILGQWQVSLHDRLTGQLGARLDNNSTLGPGSNWFLLPKVGVSWVISEEPFWHLGFVNSLRLRAAWGQTGRAPNNEPTAALETFIPLPYIDGSLPLPGAVFGNPGNDHLKVERGEEFEGGFDAAFLNERIGLEVTYFNKTTKDLLLKPNQPPSLVPDSLPWANVSSVVNRGFEIGVRAMPISNPTISWNVRLGLNTLHNEVTDLGEVAPFGTLNRVEEGMQLGAWVTNRILSINEATGVVTVTEDRKFYKNVAPTFEANLSTDLTLLRNLRVYASLDTKRGHGVRNFSDFFRETQLVRSDKRLDPNMLSPRERLRRYGNPNAPGVPAFVTPSGVAKTVNDVQEAYIQDGDFVRLREVSLTYTLPVQAARAFRAKTASITVGGQNVALWTAYEGFDPEVNSAAIQNFNRDDFFTQPPVRRWLVKVNLTF